MITLQHILYTHISKDALFDNISLTLNTQEKVALIGNNGAGKSTLLKIIAGALSPSAGLLKVNAEPYYVPQNFGQFNDSTVAQALQIEGKLRALTEILNGNVTEDNMNLLADDWTIEERCAEALHHWQLNDLSLTQKMSTLSGGQKTKVLLAGISIHQPELVLLDEPSNHLDMKGREILYHYIQSTRNTLIVVSHDRTLLNLMDTVCELSKNGIKYYGGNYDFYTAQKLVENTALAHDLQTKEKALRKAKEKEREATERQQKLDSRGKGKQEKAGVARIMMNTMRNNAEKSTSKIKSVHAEKIGSISDELLELRSAIPAIDKMKLGFDGSGLHKGKVIFDGKNINFRYKEEHLWSENLNLQILSGDRIALKGQNGSGKTTLIKLVLGTLEPHEGTVFRAEVKSVFIDQDYSLLDNKLTVYEQARQFNTSALLEHAIKMRLSRFLFGSENWTKPCSSLSGGERMRLLLCCLTISNQSPDLLILDEPTNNLDLQNIEILTAAIREFEGSLLIVSHDEHFLKALNIERFIDVN